MGAVKVLATPTFVMIMHKNFNIDSCSPSIIDVACFGGKGGGREGGKISINFIAVELHYSHKCTLSI